MAAAEEAVQIAEDKVKDRIVQSGDSVVQSEYWGLTPEKHFREDGSDWPWQSFRVRMSDNRIATQWFAIISYSRFNIRPFSYVILDSDRFPFFPSS